MSGALPLAFEALGLLIPLVQDLVQKNQSGTPVTAADLAAVKVAVDKGNEAIQAS